MQFHVLPLHEMQLRVAGHLRHKHGLVAQAVPRQRVSVKPLVVTHCTDLDHIAVVQEVRTLGDLG
jgi:hypothetical protein